MTIIRQAKRQKGKAMKRIGIALATFILAALLWLAYLGYFGGTLLVPIAAKANPAMQRAHIAAVVLSGDMGINVGMAKNTAERLSRDGIPVVGVNSLVYFRKKRTPDQVERLLAHAIAAAEEFGHAQRVVLIGQSFGADMIPVGLSRMPESLRQQIVAVALVVPTDTLFLRASPSELFNWTAPDADALPTARQLDWLPVTCISGREETESLCPHFHSPNVTWVTLPGGHYLHRDAAAVHRLLRQAIDRALQLPNHYEKFSVAPPVR